MIRLSVLAVLLFAGLLAAEEKRDERPVSKLIECLSSEDAETRNSATEALNYYFGLIQGLPDFTDEETWIEYERTLKELKLQLKPHSKQLQKLLESSFDESRTTSASLLALIGPDAVAAGPKLLEFIHSKETSFELWQAAVIAMLHITPIDQPVGPALLRASTAEGQGTMDELIKLHGQTEAIAEAKAEEQGAALVSVMFARILQSSGRTMIEVPTLVKLTSPVFRKGIRFMAINTLMLLGPEVKSAIPALRKLLEDDDLGIRQCAGHAILLINCDREELPNVLTMLHLNEQKSEEFRQAFLNVLQGREEHLEWCRNNSAKLVPKLIRHFKNGNPFCQREAMRFLGEIGPASKLSVPDLLLASKSNVESIRDTALVALKKIDPASLPLEFQTRPQKP